MNKVTVTIAGQEYNLVAGEKAAYMEKVAAYVDGKMKEVMEGSRVSTSDAAVLSALNLADELFKEQEAGEKLRAQIKGYLEESTDLKRQLSEAKRQLFAAQNQKKS